MVSGGFRLLHYGAELKVDINELRQLETFHMVSYGFIWFHMVSGGFRLLQYGAKLKVDINELRQLETFHMVSGGFRLFQVVALWWEIKS